MHRERCEEDPGGGACGDRRSAEPAALPSSEPGVWLGGNSAAGAIAALFGLIAGVVVALLLAVAPGRVPATVRWGVAAMPAILGVAAGLAAWRARLRLGRREVIVSLSPWRLERVPLEFVECFFLGSRLEPPRDAATSGGDRVRTLVMRIAERTADHAARPTLPAWGSWSEGSVTFDGRWCAPLSVDLVRRLNKALAEAKRTGQGERKATAGGA